MALCLRAATQNIVQRLPVPAEVLLAVFLKRLLGEVGAGDTSALRVLHVNLRGQCASSEKVLAAPLHDTLAACVLNLGVVHADGRRLVGNGHLHALKVPNLGGAGLCVGGGGGRKLLVRETDLA
eukprot:CAMPEP_0198547330 /NCGR_PEP_ID=MMETSP1462-20131121/67494_1 /TAXON_ID=1333877 /ORGANISM="Brandtodinium nutriculum, Strain RCC3387" /LENGTH=123 /DNA_ID=CAMNT_0044277813 /DNA_START=337 /DNA_END=708 /DNA_ORIENTATION=+